VDVPVHPVGRLLGRGAGFRIREREDPDVAPFVALSNALDRDERGKLVCEAPDDPGEIVVPVVAVK
jgi:hypothetical protein